MFLSLKTWIFVKSWDSISLVLRDTSKELTVRNLDRGGTKGMNPKKLQAMIPILEKEVRNGEVAGVRVSVLHQGEEVFQYSCGYRDVERKLPIEEDTIIRLFSMSKPVTAVAAMILYERGELDLFTPVSDYIEGFIDQKVYTKEGLVEAKRPILVRDLLNMTSPVLYPDPAPGNVVGNMSELYYQQIQEEMCQGKQKTTKEFILGLNKLPLAFQPGEHWQYSASADILGAVIEEVSGKRFGAFLQEEIFEPLGMVDTAFYVPENKRDRFAEAFRYNPVTDKNEPYTDHHLCVGDWLSEPAFESGGAGLVSTMRDYKRFAQMLLNKGEFEGTRILGRKTVEFMASNQLTKEQKKTVDWESMWGYGYGNLMRVLEDLPAAGSNGSLGEFGWDGWMGNYFFVDPEDEMIFLYFIQAADARWLQTDRRKLRQILFGSL